MNTTRGMCSFRFAGGAVLWAFLAAATLSCGVKTGSDWPTDGHDIGRSGVTADNIGYPLGESWRYVMASPPEPAWPEPAAQDYWHGVHTLSSGIDYDKASHIVAADGTLYFGSSSDSRIYALDARSGREKWSFATEGPVRFAPTVYNKKVYAGSDDGRVYCLDSRTGRLVWSANPSGEDRRLPGNEHIISSWPLRTCLVVDADTVWCSAGLFPTSGTFLYALGAYDGAVLWSKKLDISPQGLTAASKDHLIVPTGRTQPAIFDRRTGDMLGRLNGPGGSYAIVTDAGTVNGPGRREGDITMSDADTPGAILNFAGLRMALVDSVAYIQSRESLTAINRTRYASFTADINALEQERKEALALPDSDATRNSRIAVIETKLKALAEERETCRLWERPCGLASSMIIAGNLLFAGGSDSVAVIDIADGSLKGSLAVEGDACVLAAANGKLYVSTDKGVIQCFESGISPHSKPRIIEAAQSHHDPKFKTGADISHAAEHILAETGMDKGWCLDAGCKGGELACALAARSGLMIVCAAPDQVTAEKARTAIRKAGFDTRITVHVVAADSLPYTANLFNLIVSESALSGEGIQYASSEVTRVLRPCGGTAFLGGGKQGDDLRHWASYTSQELAWTDRDGGWISASKGALPGSGEWVQLYHDASNTSSSADSLKGPVALQWFGKPGPRGMIDRHHRTMSPLYKDGRVFVPGNDRIYGIDAYNGTLIWEKHIPGSRRVGALKDCGYIVIDGGQLMIALGDSCLALDTASGSEKHVYRIPDSANDSGGPAEWGYISSGGGRILGTVQKKGASFRDQDFVGSPLNGSYLQEEDFREVITGRSLFSLDSASGETVWSYRGGTLMNNSIALGDGRLYFIETGNSAISGDPDGRVRIDRFCERDTHVAALDLDTGKPLWKRPVSLPFQHIMFLCYADNTVLVTGTYNVGNTVYYGLYTFRADSGAPLWKTNYVATNIRGTAPAAPNGSHGEQWQHPVITGGTVFLRPYAFDLKTGAKLEYTAFRGGHGCGGLTGSVHYLFGRGSTPRMYPTDVPETEGIELSTVSRPGCWLNMIPAGGLVIIPESSSGCTCGYPIQTSLAFMGM